MKAVALVELNILLGIEQTKLSKLNMFEHVHFLFLKHNVTFVKIYNTV